MSRQHGQVCRRKRAHRPECLDPAHRFPTATIHARSNQVSAGTSGQFVTLPDFFVRTTPHPRQSPGRPDGRAIDGLVDRGDRPRSSPAVPFLSKIPDPRAPFSRRTERHQSSRERSDRSGHAAHRPHAGSRQLPLSRSRPFIPRWRTRPAKRATCPSSSRFVTRGQSHRPPSRVAQGHEGRSATKNDSAPEEQRGALAPHASGGDADPPTPRANRPRLRPLRQYEQRRLRRPGYFTRNRAAPPWLLPRPCREK